VTASCGDCGQIRKSVQITQVSKLPLVESGRLPPGHRRSIWSSELGYLASEGDIIQFIAMK